MSEVRLYAVGMAEVRGMLGASEDQAAALRAIAQQAFAVGPPPTRVGLLHKLGPLFRRAPDAPVAAATDPEPRDVDVLLAGAYVSPDRAGATWRILETLVCGTAWGSTRLSLNSTELDELDFALAAGGVSAAVGLRHLLETDPALPLPLVSGLRVGWHHYEQALAMAGAYRTALPQLERPEQRGLVVALSTWLDGFVPWGSVAASLGRPVPDLIGFWAE